MIKGLTDTFVIRRDGKIRAGYKQDGERGALKNTKHFLLHDAPQLIPVLGESPEEIYFTVYTDNVQAVAQHDLRSYSKSELLCLGNGETAAYFANGDAEGVRQRPHAKFAKSRERVCQYKQCGDYAEGRCSEHLFLDMVIPQYSMASLFTLDNSSINGLLNVLSALNKAQIRHAGKISGQIFRLYKQDMDMTYQNPKTGAKSKSPRPVIHMEYVPFETYERMFRDKISNEDWEALLALRSRTMLVGSANVLEGPSAQTQLEAPVAGPQSQLTGPDQSDEDVVRERANNPTVIALFDELAELRGKANTEEARINTAKMVPGVQALIDWLKKSIAADKKKRAAQLAVSIESEAAASPAPSPTAIEGVIQTTGAITNSVPASHAGESVDAAQGLF